MTLYLFAYTKTYKKASKKFTVEVCDTIKAATNLIDIVLKSEPKYASVDLNLFTA